VGNVASDQTVCEKPTDMPFRLIPDAWHVSAGGRFIVQNESTAAASGTTGRLAVFDARTCSRRGVVGVPDGGGTWFAIVGSSRDGRRLFVSRGAAPAGSVETLWETLVVSLDRLVVEKRLPLPFRLVAVVA